MAYNGSRIGDVANFEKQMFNLKINFNMNTNVQVSNSAQIAQNCLLPEVPLSDTELVSKCSQWISKLCESGGKAWTLRVPVDFTHDPDVLFSELIKRFEASRKRVG
jgi:hypothetical protein